MPPYCNDHNMHYRLAYVDGLPFQQLVCVICQSHRLSGFDLPKAIETTEILNEVKADKGILTEEELTLNEKILYNSFRATAIYDTDHNLIEDIIASHRAIQERTRNLVLENDEQTALLRKSKDFIDAIMSFYGQNLMVMGWHQNGDGEPFDNFIDDNLDGTLLDELKLALEETK